MVIEDERLCTDPGMTGARLRGVALKHSEFVAGSVDFAGVT